MRGARWGIAGPWTPITQHKSVSHFNYIHASASPIHCSHNQVSCRDLTPCVSTIWTLLAAKRQSDMNSKIFPPPKSDWSCDVWHRLVFRRRDIKGVSSWSRICGPGLSALQAACSLNVDLSICPRNCWLSWHTRPLNISAPYREREDRTPSRRRVTAEGEEAVCARVCVCRGGVKSPPVRLLASAEEAVSLTVSRRRVLTF